MASFFLPQEVLSRPNDPTAPLQEMEYYELNLADEAFPAKLSYVRVVGGSPGIPSYR